MYGYFKLILIIFALGAAASTSGMATEPSAYPEIKTLQTTPLRDARGFIEAYIDEENALDINNILERRDRLAFRTVTDVEPDFGFTKAAIWLHMRISGEETAPTPRYVILGTNFIPDGQVWVVDGPEITKLLDQNPDSDFASRQVVEPILTTEFILPPGRTVDLWIRYTSRGSTALPIHIESEDSFREWSKAFASKLNIFYTFMAVLILSSLLAFINKPRRIFLAYAAYSLSVLLYIMHFDGIAFQLLWPGAPRFNSFASLPLGCATSVFGAQFAREFLDTKNTAPRADIVLKTVIAVAFVLVSSAYFVGDSGPKFVASIWGALAALIGLVTGLLSLRNFERRKLYFVLGWTGVLIGVTIISFQNLFQLELTRFEGFDVLRVTMSFDALMMGLAVLESVSQLRKDRDATLRRNMVEAERNLALHRRLSRLEERYSEAQSLVSQYDKAHEDASHDIRPPLFALRASIRGLVERGGGGTDEISGLSENLTYLESLVDDLIKARRNATGGAETGEKSAQAAPMAMVFDALTDMFSAEAAAKGLKLIIVPSSLAFPGSSMAILRILSNFLSNAIRYTDDGRILVGVRRSRGRLVIEVHDTGQGLTEEGLALVMMRGVRGENAERKSAGSGLGLAIACEVAAANGLEIGASSRPGRGSVFSLKSAATGPL